ncbi:MAG: SPOR domain-containing protein [Pseudomonadota bacterium]|nr:SPOR domain-containing protein [Pseudomonadota bacterium]
MARAAAIDPSDRLPWLSEPSSEAAPRRSMLPVVLIAAAAGAAGAAGWTVLQRAIAPETPTQVAPVETVRRPSPVVVREPTKPPVSDRETVSLPVARPTPAAEPVPVPKANVAPPAREASAVKPKPSARKARPARKRPTATARAPASRAAARTSTYDPRAWNSGVQGRIIQLGAFRTPAQANGQWNRVYYRYPVLRPLPPRVVRTSIRGRTYYRLQLGTFSHAHSELLCQRLRAIGEGCMVLGLNRRGRRA